MHNLHIVRITSTSAEDACADVENQLAEWGNENNWRTICGSVCEDDTTFQSGDGRWNTDGFTVDKLNTMVREWIYNPSVYEPSWDKIIKGVEEIGPYDWYSAKKYCEEQYHKKSIGTDLFDIRTHEYYSWRIDECGVTAMDMYSPEELDEKTYYVFVDMHS